MSRPTVQRVNRGKPRVHPPTPAAPPGVRVEACCPARKCRKAAGHDNGVHERNPLGLAAGR
jgi:hypothetical protein